MTGREREFCERCRRVTDGVRSVAIAREMRDVAEDMARVMPEHPGGLLSALVREYDAGRCPHCGAPNGGGYITPGCPECVDLKHGADAAKAGGEDA